MQSLAALLLVACEHCKLASFAPEETSQALTPLGGLYRHVTYGKASAHQPMTVPIMDLVCAGHQPSQEGLGGRLQQDWPCRAHLLCCRRFLQGGDSSSFRERRRGLDPAPGLPRLAGQRNCGDPAERARRHGSIHAPRDSLPGGGQRQHHHNPPDGT